MSVLKIYALRDVRTQAYMRPMFLQNDAVLDRSVRDAMLDENSLLCSHPEDYQVFRLGEYDDNTGKITPCDPTHMFNVVDLQEKE